MIDCVYLILFILLILSKDSSLLILSKILTCSSCQGGVSSGNASSQRLSRPRSPLQRTSSRLTSPSARPRQMMGGDEPAPVRLESRAMRPLGFDRATGPPRRWGAFVPQPAADSRTRRPLRTVDGQKRVREYAVAPADDHALAPEAHHERLAVNRAARWARRLGRRLSCHPAHRTRPDGGVPVRRPARKTRGRPCEGRRRPRRSCPRHPPARPR